MMASPATLHSPALHLTRLMWQPNFLLLHLHPASVLNLAFNLTSVRSRLLQYTVYAGIQAVCSTAFYAMSALYAAPVCAVSVAPQSQRNLVSPHSVCG